MSLVYRAIEKLLPRGEAWKLTVNKTLTKFMAGLAAGVPEDFRNYVIDVWLNLFPASTTNIDGWSDQFGLFPSATEAAKRQNVDTAWKATGGQGIDYFQALIDAAGFEVTVHASLDPLTELYRRPLDFLPPQPDVGNVQCGALAAHCDEPSALCSGLQLTSQGHIVNQSLSGLPQPKISDDPLTYPLWIYVGGPIFGERAMIPAEREIEFLSLILGVFPGNYWIGYMVDGISNGTWIDEGNIWEDDKFWDDNNFWGNT